MTGHNLAGRQYLNYCADCGKAITTGVKRSKVYCDECRRVRRAIYDRKRRNDTGK